MATKDLMLVYRYASVLQPTQNASVSYIYGPPS
jgi:hypothetical protein